MLYPWILMPATCNHAMQIKMAIDHVIFYRFNAMNVVSMVILSEIVRSYVAVVRSSRRTGGVKRQLLGNSQLADYQPRKIRL